MATPTCSLPPARWLRPGTCLAAALALLLGVRVDAEEGPTDGAGHSPPAFVGSKLCMRCHVQQHKSWLETAHARATDALRPGEARSRKLGAGLDPARDYRRDGACLSCHATGYGRPGGHPRAPEEGTWTDAQRALAERASGVGCEACHGAGGRYWRVMDRNPRFRRSEIERAGAVVPVGEAACVTCHGKRCEASQKDPDFDFARCNVPEHVHAHAPLRRPH